MCRQSVVTLRRKGVVGTVFLGLAVVGFEIMKACNFSSEYPPGGQVCIPGESGAFLRNSGSHPYPAPVCLPENPWLAPPRIQNRLLAISLSEPVLPSTTGQGWNVEQRSASQCRDQGYYNDRNQYVVKTLHASASCTTGL